MYGNNDVSQREQASIARGLAVASADVPLGIFTKSQATFENTGVERLHNFILQDQACKLLPKHRVCNCLKKRIDKTKDRLVKYNVDRKKSPLVECTALWLSLD